MTVREHFARLFAHMAWADARLLDRAAHSPETLRLFSHVLAAERVWRLRLRGVDTASEPIWPTLAPHALAPMAEENARDLAAFVEGLSEEGFEAEVVYRNSAGTEFRTAVVDILTQVAMHGSYHRGQIAALLRAQGGEPIPTDFIVFARERAAR